MNTFRAELHIHTVLSPCSEIEMMPELIIQTALDRGINILAITDHNSTANIPAVIKAAEGSGIIVFSGVEVQTKEEVHCLCLFDTFKQAVSFQHVIDDHLPDTRNAPAFFGNQLILNDLGEIIGEEERLLLTSLDLPIDQTAQIVSSLDGLFIPAHVDRKSFGLFEILGFVPAALKLDALEISKNISQPEALRKFPQISGYPLLQNGDAHRLNEIMGFILFKIGSPNLSEIRKALRSLDGRETSLLPLKTT